jgi:Ca2+-binding RTX toxin-like protein
VRGPRPRIGSLSIFIALLAALILAPSALATNIPAVNYQPPKITFVDQIETGTVEDVTITKQGSDYVFSNTSGVVKHMNSQPGCTDTFAIDYHCPVAGITKIVVRLAAMDDEASIDLGSKATTVKQLLLGGAGEDTIHGGPGKQKIKGQAEADILSGGPGPDVIDGGPGTDTCAGGPGKDVLKNCE